MVVMVVNDRVNDMVNDMVNHRAQSDEKLPSPAVAKIVYMNPGVTPFRDDEHTPSRQIAVQK